MSWNDLGAGIIGADAFEKKEAMKPGNVTGRSDIGAAFAAVPLSEADLQAQQAARLAALEAAEMAQYDEQEEASRDEEPEPVEVDMEELALATARAETARKPRKHPA